MSTAPIISTRTSSSHPRSVSRSILPIHHHIDLQVHDLIEIDHDVHPLELAVGGMQMTGLGSDNEGGSADTASLGRDGSEVGEGGLAVASKGSEMRTLLDRRVISVAP